MSKDIEIECEVLVETPKALFISDGKQTVWLPKSQINDQCEDKHGKITSVFISEWLATEKGLV
jgi:hypothetical protein